VAPWIAPRPGRTPVASEAPPPCVQTGETRVLAAANQEFARGERAALLLTIHEQHSAHIRAIQQLADDRGAELSMREAEWEAVNRGLQAELHEKVGEANRVIVELQAEMHGKVSERDQLLRERNELILGLEERIRERDEIIRTNLQWIIDLRKRFRAIRMLPAWQLVRVCLQLRRSLRGIKHKVLRDR